MPRPPRHSVPGQPQHVIHRGNNRTRIFLAPEEFRFYHDCLRTATERLGCQIYAYVLMTNHIHLLISEDTAGMISTAMQSVGRRYVRYFNDRHDRSGTLWEGRYRSTLVDTDEYLLTCYRYIEENPVRAGLAAHPSAYLWSSYAANALGAEDPLVTPHDRYLALGSTPESRRTAYRELFHTALELSTLNSIRAATNRALPIGNDRFRMAVGRVSSQSNLALDSQADRVS